MHVLWRSGLQSVHLGQHPSQTKGCRCMGWCSLHEAVSDLVAQFDWLPGQAHWWDEISSSALPPFAWLSWSKCVERAGEFLYLGVGSGKSVNSEQQL